MLFLTQTTDYDSSAKAIIKKSIKLKSPPKKNRATGREALAAITQRDRIFRAERRLRPSFPIGLFRVTFCIKRTCRQCKHFVPGR